MSDGILKKDIRDWTDEELNGYLSEADTITPPDPDMDYSPEATDAFIKKHLEVRTRVCYTIYDKGNAQKSPCTFRSFAFVLNIRKGYIRPTIRIKGRCGLRQPE